MTDSGPAPLADVLGGFDTVVEVGIGERHDVAATLAERGVRVTATDVVERQPPAAVSFVRDDVTDPDPSVYADAGLVYALNCPPELHASLVAVAREAGATAMFTTLGGDPPAVPARPRTLPIGTLHVARTRHP